MDKEQSENNGKEANELHIRYKKSLYILEYKRESQTNAAEKKYTQMMNKINERIVP